MRINMMSIYFTPNKRYLSASYEPVDSRFSLSFNSVVNLLQRNPQERIRELVEMLSLAKAQSPSVKGKKFEQLNVYRMVDRHSPHRTQKRTRREYLVVLTERKIEHQTANSARASS